MQKLPSKEQQRTRFLLIIAHTKCWFPSYLSRGRQGQEIKRATNENGMRLEIMVKISNNEPEMYFKVHFSENGCVQLHVDDLILHNIVEGFQEKHHICVTLEKMMCVYICAKRVISTLGSTL